MKKEDPIIDGLEVDDFGKPVYLHARECGGYCDYACNTPQGDQVAQMLEDRMEVCALLKRIVDSWSRKAGDHSVPFELRRSAHDYLRKITDAELITLKALEEADRLP